MLEKEREKRFRAALREFQEAAEGHAFCNSEWPFEARKRCRERLRDARREVLRLGGINVYS